MYWCTSAFTRSMYKRWLTSFGQGSNPFTVTTKAISRCKMVDTLFHMRIFTSSNCTGYLDQGTSGRRLRVSLDSASPRYQLGLPVWFICVGVYLDKNLIFQNRKSNNAKRFYKNVALLKLFGISWMEHFARHAIQASFKAPAQQSQTIPWSQVLFYCCTRWLSWNPCMP